MKILIIEDEDTIREEVADWLLFEEYEVVSACNGREGVEMAISALPDLIVSDINMPEIDGYEVLQTLQMQPTTAMIPFIFLTARTDRQSMRYGMDLGADDYLTKPFSHSELMNAIQSRLTKHAFAISNYKKAEKRATAELQAVPNASQGSLSGKVIRGYQIQDKLGEGGGGVVYRAYQAAVGREVAVKVLKEKYANNLTFLQRFQTEAEMIARLEHPHIIPLYDYWRDESGIFVVMRLLRGGSLHKVVQKMGCWNLAATLRLLNQVADALSVAHGAGIVHRDLKPDNILLDANGNSYLTDFGLAKDLVSGVPESAIPDGVDTLLDVESKFFEDDMSDGLFYTDGAQTIGTPAYLSPEQIRLQSLSPHSDIYSLGISLYEILVGEPPFKGSISDVVMQHLNDPMPSIHAQRPDIPSAVDDVLQIATAKDWTQRYSNILLFATDFHQAARGIRPIGY